MNQNLREPITHGSAEYPFALYHIRASLHAFNVSLHWHDEVEIIYIKKGNLHLIIDKDSYLGTAGDIFIVNSQEIHEMSVEEWHHVIHTNLDSMFYTSRYAIPLMLHKKSGKIINISSVWGNVGASMEVAYSASKGGVNSFTKALAKELAPSHIQVNAIACGVIDTDMNRCFSKEDMEALREEIPADRIGQPAEVAQMVLSVLQTPEYLTGQIITLDGAWI